MGWFAVTVFMVTEAEREKKPIGSFGKVVEPVQSKTLRWRVGWFPSESAGSWAKST